MRKLFAAVLALPVIVGIYASAALQRSLVARLGVALGLGAFIAFGVMSFARPTLTTATRTTEIVPLTQAAFKSSISTNVAVDAPMTIAFTTAMARDSVATALTVDPPTPVRLSWDASGTTLTITPRDRWQAGTYHTITVQPGALALTGRPLTTPARAVFLTRAPGAAALAATDPVGKRVAADTSFTLTFDRPVDPASLEAGVRLEPAVAGRIVAQPSRDGATIFVFQPTTPLKADARYRLVVDGVKDADGLAIASSSLNVRILSAPEVVRFRPRDGTDKVERGTAVSVRFTTSMDRASTKRAFKVTAGGKAVDGKATFAENDTVLVFVPGSPLPYGATIVAKVAASAESRDGVSVAKAADATFQTVEKPKPRPAPKAPPKAPPKKSTPSGGSSGGGGGGSVGSGSWTAVERYYLGLMNCTRTGGWVTSTGSCSSPGGRNVAALKLSAGISSKVSRPYARRLARAGECTHFIGGTPGDRLRRAGYTSYRWAENLGCRSGTPYGSVLGTHRFYQSERPYLGGHYVNLMNSKYDRVGIGVWVSSGRVRLVVDFYHP